MNISQSDNAEKDNAQIDNVQKDMVQKDIAQKDIVQKDIAQKDIAQKDKIQKDIAQKVIAQKDKVQKDIAQKDIAQKDIAQKVIAQKDNLQKDIAQKDNVQKNNTWINISKYIALAIFIIMAFLIAKFYNIASLNQFFVMNEGLGYVICLFVYIVLDFTFIPNNAITLLVLAWMGPVAAVLLDTIGDTILAMADYFIGRKAGYVADLEEKKSKLPFHLGQIPIDSPTFLILGRMLPAIGPKFVSLTAGAYKVSIRTYLWTTVVANLIGAIFIVSGGYGLIKVFQGFVRNK
ncbi:MAG TPA: VTT domain-containing protein [Anaerolineaceae bacterium]|nr:VTT domain-containing protein [Anaerolineaceae bacterium]